MNVDPNRKILTLIQASSLCEYTRENTNKTIGLTNGCFDLIHRGHLEYLYKSL